MQVSEILGALKAEVDLVQGDLMPWLEAIAENSEDPARDAYRAQLERTQETCAMLGLAALAQWLQMLLDSLAALGNSSQEERLDWAEAHAQWPGALVDYLQAHTNEAARAGLISCVEDPRLLLPIDLEGTVQLQMTLAEPIMVPDEFNEAPAERETATLQDTSLTVPVDVDASVYDAFIGDAAEQAVQLSVRVLQVLQGQDETGAALVEARRIAHSFKGVAAMIGIRGISRLAHRLEDILDFLASLAEVPELPKALSDTLQDATATLEQQVYAVMGEEEPPSNAMQVLQAVLDWDYNLKTNGLAEPDLTAQAAIEVIALQDLPAVVIEHPPVEEQVHQALELAREPDLELAIDFEFDELDEQLSRQSALVAPAPAHRPVEAPPIKATAQAVAPPTVTAPAALLVAPGNVNAASANASSEEEATTRVPVRRIDEFLRTAGELFMGSSQLREALDEAQARQKALLAQNLAMQTRLAELDRAVSLRGVSLKANEASGIALDALELDQYNELYGLTKALYESSADFKDMADSVQLQLGGLSAQALRQELTARNFQRLVLGTRLQPAGTLTARLKRNTRQTARSTGKEAEVTVTGEEVMLDREVLDQLGEPLLHLLRNAVDHGIELPGVRRLAGKPTEGRVTVQFREQAGAVEAIVRDDGAGLNYSAIWEKGIERGILAAEHEPSEAELARLILQSGFTTRGSISEVSGRGVGMDVVRERLERMGGSVQIASQTGQGSTFTLRFPASRALFFVLLVRVANQLFAVPAAAVQTALAPGMGTVVQTPTGWQFSYNAQSMPLRRLTDAMGVAAQTGLQETPIAQMSVVIVRGSEGDAAVAVETIVASREVLLQPLHPVVANTPGLLGAVIMPDGSIAPVLDVANLLRDQASSRSLGASQRQLDDNRPLVLVVDDSLSVRRSLVQLLGDSGYRTQTAFDGMDAITQLATLKPALILTDLEMPNVNGLDLTRHVRNRVDLQHIPVIMVTSRSMDKHRQMADQAGVTRYVTKPYTDDDLLDELAGLQATV
jgi:chemotaxis protein histidine kinase CheA/ActR/RegA family two-component response regulator